MRVRRRYVCGALVLAGVGASYLMLTPRLRLATRAEIEAALPASLRVVDPPDPAGEARYARLVEIVGRFKKEKPRAVFAELDALLREGGLVASEGRMDVTNLRALAHGLLLRAGEGDRAACLRDALLALRFGQALCAERGPMGDVLSAVTVDGEIVREVYRLDTKGAFDARGREAVLAELPPLEESVPRAEDLMRREFQNWVVPMLVDPRKYLAGRTVGAGSQDLEMVGSYDALETARLMGRLCEINMAQRRPYTLHNTEFWKLYNEATWGLPQPPNPSPRRGLRGFFDRVRYRWGMNSGHNTLGLSMVRDVDTGFSPHGIQRAARRNLLRAVLLLRMGRPMNVSDPFATGLLKVDPKRRIVWSVGSDGVDNGGNVGPGRLLARDLGLRY